MNLAPRSRMCLSRAAAALLLAALLAGCESQTASYVGAQNGDALTLVREKPYLWSRAYQLSVVVAHLPDCQRRHALQDAPLDAARVEVFRSLEGGYILKQGSRYYVAETGQCQLQVFTTPPRESGDPLGVFETKNGRLAFVPAIAKGAGT